AVPRSEPGLARFARGRLRPGREAGDGAEIGPACDREIGGVVRNGVVGKQVRQVHQSRRKDLPADEERLDLAGRAEKAAEALLEYHLDLVGPGFTIPVEVRQEQVAA